METNLNSYPTKKETDPNILLQGLGSFWNFIFTEKATLRGYTFGWAEEVIQSYLNLIETVNTYSIKDCPVFHTENWKPLIVTKSSYGKVDFVFEQGSAEFGPQPDTDEFYRGDVFKFGLPKTSAEQVYTVEIPNSYSNFSVIANQVISPSRVFVQGIDVIVQNGALYFNKDIFNDTLIPKSDVIGENGIPVTYVDDQGNVVQDQMLILWIYNLLEDTSYLHDNFGYIYGLTSNSISAYKEVLKSIVNICVEGPTVKAFKYVLAAFANIPVVIENEETIEEIFNTDNYRIVATDLNCYRFTLESNFLNTTVVGSKVRSGDILVDTIEYYDTSVLPSWWSSVLASTPSIPFSSHIFLGNYQFQLFFGTSLDLVTLSTDDVLNFPVEGRVEDVERFQTYINLPENKDVIKDKLGLSPTNISTPIVPAYWVFENFFKNNCVMVKLKFSTIQLTSNFFDYLEILKELLPAHVYVIFDVTLSASLENYSNLNGHYTIPAYPNQSFNCDGSNLDGSIPNIAPYYYTDLTYRMFVLGKSPVVSTKPLSDNSNLDTCLGNAVTGSGIANMLDGRLLRPIPSGATNQKVREIKLINFSI